MQESCGKRISRAHGIGHADAEPRKELQDIAIPDRASFTVTRDADEFAILS